MSDNNQVTDSPDKAATPKRSPLDWCLDKLLAPLVTLLVGLLLGSWWNSTAPYLRFASSEVIKYQGEKEEFGIFIATITNDGRKRAEQVRCDVLIDGCEIQDLKAGPENLDATVEITKSKKNAVITIPSLNANEAVELAVKASNPNEISKSLKISVRANDVVGVEGKKSPRRITSLDLTAILAAMGGMIWASVTIALGVDRTKDKLDAVKLFLTAYKKEILLQKDGQ